MKEAVKITRTSILGDIESNLTREAMAEKYGISKQSVAKALAQAGFKGVRVKTPAFIYVDDTVETELPVINTGDNPKVADDGFTPNYAGMGKNYDSMAQM